MMEIASLKTADMQGMKMPMAVIYNSPQDFPGEYVCRLWEAATASPTDIYTRRKTLREIRDDLRASGFKIRLLRAEEDDPVIVESWMR